MMRRRKIEIIEIGAGAMKDDGTGAKVMKDDGTSRAEEAAIDDETRAGVMKDGVTRAGVVVVIGDENRAGVVVMIDDETDHIVFQVIKVNIVIDHRETDLVAGHLIVIHGKEIISHREEGHRIVIHDIIIYEKVLLAPHDKIDCC